LHAVLLVTLAVDPAKRTEACGIHPANVCRFLFEQTENVGLAKAGDFLFGPLLQIVLVLLGAFVLNRLLRRAIRRFASRIAGSNESGRLKRIRDRTPNVFLATGEWNLRSAARAQTIAAVLRSLCSAVIFSFALIYVLGYLGLNLGPLLAGAGVAGVALGFGAQSLVKDFLSGTFMLIEDQFGVGDIIDAGEASGVVEALTLRTTRLRDQEGTVWHIPNGQIQRVGNKSQQWARAVLDLTISPSADFDRAQAVIRTAAAEVWADPRFGGDVLDEPEVLGVEYLGPDGATIRVVGKTRPASQWTVGRALRAHISTALRDAGIDVPPATWTRAGVPPAK
jgi:small-conductance mechanosensitive channel